MSASSPSTCSARSSRSSGRSSRGREWSRRSFLGTADANNLVTAKGHREELELLTRSVKEFKAANKLDRLIIVNLGSTERHAEVADVHRTVAAFEAGLTRNDDRASARR